MEKTLFIIGVGRSGTTLLMSMLNAHPEVIFLPESHLVFDQIAPQVRGGRQFHRSTGELIRFLNKDPYASRLEVDFESMVSQYVDLNERYYLADLFRGIMKEYSSRFNKPIVGEKFPQNAEVLPEIRKVFPDAFILHIIRDPRDVILSRLKSDWGKKYPFIVHVLEYKYGIQKARTEGSTLFEDHYYEIFYERLLENPKEELEKLCDAISIKFNPNMLSYFEKAEHIVTEEEKSWKGNVFKPIMKKNFNKWKSEMASSQVFLTEALLHPELGQLNYEIQNGSNTLIRIIGAALLPLYAVFKLWKSLKALINA